MIYELKTIDDSNTTFANHPMAETYFKYVEILKSKDMGTYAKHLTKIAHSPMNEDIRNEISDIMSALFRVMDDNTDHTNEFIELGKEFDKGLVS
jgi:hypothetical protein